MTDDLDALRISRTPERPRARGSFALVLAVTVAGLATLATTGYAVYARTLGRPTVVHTVIVAAAPRDQPAVILTGSGYVVTRHKYIVVGTKVLGQIVEEPIEEGMYVKRGDLLARIDDRDYQAQLRQTIADRELADANLHLAESKVARRRELRATGSIAQEELDQAENDLAVARASVAHDDAAIDYAKFNVSQCLIVSPIDGIVLQKYRELGATINYGGQVAPSSGATDIAELADTRDMRAEVDINESDIAKVAMGMPAVIVPDAYPNTHFDATLVKIYPEADRQKATVKVELHFTRPDMAIIKPELSVKANFLERRAAGDTTPRVEVPPTAIVRDGAGSYVWTVQNGVAHRVSAAKDGDVVIVAPPPGLTEGQKVRPNT